MWQSFVFAILGFCTILLILKISFPYLAPFFIGLFLDLILDGPVNCLEQRGCPRALSSLILISITFLGLPVFLLFFLMRLWQEVQGLLVFGPVEQWTSVFSERVVLLLERLTALNPSLNPVNFANLTETMFRWALAIPDLLLIWSLAAFSAYFFSKDKKLLTKAITKQLPRHSRFSFFKLYHDTSGALWYLLRVQFLLMLIATSISMAFFSLLQLPYALLLGFLVGFFDLVPVLGPGLVYLFLAIIQIWLGNLPIAIALGVAYLILLFIRQWGQPHLVSDRLGLHPLLALIGLYVGFRFWGLMGAMIGPILMVFIKAFMATYSTT